MPTSRLLLLSLSLLSSAIIATVPVSAAVIHVPNDAATIQAGIDLSVDGDVVLVAGGTWVGAGNRDLDFGGRAITVRSINGPAGCIIHCLSFIADYRGFWFHNGESAESVLRGFTITSGSGASGAGIRCSGASPTIIDCVITNCIAQSYGGGIYGENSSPRLIDCRINSCFASTGGGAYFNGGAPLLENCRLDNNSAQGDTLPALGGGFYSNSSSPTILHSVFENNSAPLFGGGIAAWGSTVETGNCLLTGNSAGIGGGGIYVSLTSLDATSLTVAANSAPAGPAVWCFDSTVTVIDSIVLGAGIPALGVPDPVIHTDSGTMPTVTWSNVEGGYPGTGNISDDPRFTSGPAGPWYLGRMATGQPADSPCLDTGSGPADTVCFTGPGGTACLEQLTTCSDQRADDGTADMGWHAGLETLAAAISCTPGSGTLPFITRMAVTIDNLTTAERTAAGEIRLTLARGSVLEGWRSGEVLLAAGESVETAWRLTIPALPSLLGTSILDLRVEDVTASPLSDPPYPVAGQVVEGACTLASSAP